MNRASLYQILQLLAALTIATMPALIASGNRSHALTTAARSESSGSRRVAFSVAVCGLSQAAPVSSLRKDSVECS